MERIRFTISVEPDVHAAFTEMAEASGQSLSRAVGDWLRDTTAASRFVAQKMRELRLSPAAAMRELHAFEELQTAEIGRLATSLEDGSMRVGAAGDAPRRTGRRHADPPASNTGGKGQPEAGGKGRQGLKGGKP